MEQYVKDFTRLLKKHYGLHIEDVGLDEADIMNFYRQETPVKEAIEKIAMQYDLLDVKTNFY